MTTEEKTLSIEEISEKLIDLGKQIVAPKGVAELNKAITELSAKLSK